MFRKKTILIIASTVSFLFFITIHHLLSILPSTTIKTKTNKQIEQSILQIYAEIPIKHSINARNFSIIDTFLKSTKNINSTDLEALWSEANSWPQKNLITNQLSPNLGKIMNALKHAKITKADIDSRGTQLKLLLNLEPHQQCIFKPQWYRLNKTIEGLVYAGKDRYNSEIVAFYLSLLLNKPLVPISVKRTISFSKEIMPVALKKLQNTSFIKDGRTCIYGKCFYCKKEDAICEDERLDVTGAVIFNVRRKFGSYRSPWQRTYKKKEAIWEVDVEYCKTIKSKLSKKRLLDLIDTSIFDFLLQNGDRHHYETMDDTVIWLDNGKGLGNPFVQHLDILAPLYQCCMIRNRTWNSLLNLTGGYLTKFLKMMPDIEDLMTEDHFKAIEDRLLMVLAAVEYCKLDKT